MPVRIRLLHGAFTTGVAALLLCALPSHADGRTDRDVADNRALDARVAEAYHRLDVDMMMSTYAKSANLIVVFPEGTQVRGWDNVRTGYAALFSQYSGIRAEIIDSNYVATGDGMIEFGKGYLYVTPKDASPDQRLDFRFTDYRQKQNGRWVSVLDTVQAVAYQPLPTDSLYQRIGGYDLITSLADDLVSRMTADTQLKRFFEGMSSSSRKRMRQQIVDFVASASGGPVVYSGPDMHTAHAGLGISEADWQRMMALFGITMDKFRIPTKEHADLAQVFAGLRSQVVEQ